jgi:predicted CXXCH cytochrome family protein
MPATWKIGGAAARRVGKAVPTAFATGWAAVSSLPAGRVAAWSFAADSAAVSSFAAACLVSLAAAGPAVADAGPHVRGHGLTPDTCAICHRAHTARAPDLLKAPETALCYTCHGGAATGAATDVVDGVGYPGTERTGTPGALRGGGFKYALIDSAHSSGQGIEGADPGGVVPVLGAGAPVTSAHSVDSSSLTDWGNGPISAEVNDGAAISLSCGSCHDPHGNGMYRTLRPIPLQSGAAEGVEIPEPPGMRHVYTTENYWDVFDENAPDFLTKISAWCAACHTRYLSSTTGAESGDAVFTDRHVSNGTTPASPSCIQCHVAHGSNATVEGAGSFALHSPLELPAGPGSRLLRIDARGTCRMCHTEAEE